MTLDMKEPNVLGSETERDLKGQGETLPNELPPYVLVRWAFARQEAAELWLEKKDPSLIGDGKTGDCVVFNIWHIDKSLHGDFDLQAFLIRSFRDLFADKKELLARRVYPDGRVKPIRIKGRKLQI